MSKSELFGIELIPVAGMRDDRALLMPKGALAWSRDQIEAAVLDGRIVSVRLAIDKACQDAAAHGLGAVMVDENGQVQHVPHDELRLADKEGAEL